jgi:hypothetical protein
VRDGFIPMVAAYRDRAKEADSPEIVDDKDITNL